VWLKWAYTAFMMVLVPVYWASYGPTNFIYSLHVYGISGYRKSRPVSPELVL